MNVSDLSIKTFLSNRCYRLLYQWLCNPLTSVPSIIARQNAISSLIVLPDLMQEIRTELASLPDLERLFSR